MKVAQIKSVLCALKQTEKENAEDMRGKKIGIYNDKIKVMSFENDF